MNSHYSNPQHTNYNHSNCDFGCIFDVLVIHHSFICDVAKSKTGQDSQ
jgi:hypothetical protein